MGARRTSDLRPEAHDDHHHRDVQGGGLRAAVFGVSDGLVSNVALILGVAGADPVPGVVRLAGLAGLIGGACSMAAGEYVSVKAQTELLERELEVERREIRLRPEAERRELAAIYRNRGVDREIADELATQLMRDPTLALEVHAREELGVDPGSLGSPVAAAVSSFLAFAVGAILPLLPWFFAGGRGTVVASVVIGLVAAAAVGVALAVATERPWPRAVARQVAAAVLAGGVTYVVGNLVGLSGVT